MNITYETICKLVSTAMFGSAISYDKNIDWNDVFEEMKKHGIASIVGDILSDIPMGNAEKEKWKDYIFQQQVFWRKAITVQNDVRRVLDGLPYVILKGMSAAIYYPNPELRSMGDIDILVNKSNSETAMKLLKQNDYFVLNESTKQHNEYCKDGVEIELHNAYAVALTSMGKVTIENQITAGLNIAHDIHYNEYKWRVLPEIENGLTLIYHIFHHFRTGIGFRQILDWMMFVNRSSDINWNEFNRITKEDEIYKFQCVITKMCKIFFDLPHKDSIKWMDTVDTRVCEKMFDVIAYRGNFGKGISDTDFREQLILKNKSIGLMRRLQLGGILRWESAKKHKMLRPFAWVYQGCRVIRIMIQREEPIKAIFRDIEESKKIIELYDKLGIPRFDARGEKHKEV